MPNDWLLWQLIDSAFPSGGFAHSGGLEAAHQAAHVADGDSLFSFAKFAMDQAAHSALPFALASYNGPERFRELDGNYDVFLSNHVANRASRAQGRALLSSARRIFEESNLTAATHAVANGSAGHLPVVLGSVGHSLGLTVEQAADLLMFLSLRGVISAAVRLGIVGPMEGQRVQTRLSPSVAATGSRLRNVSVEDVVQTAPIQDLLQATQDRLYSRLFQS